MADPGFVRGQLAGVPDEKLRRILVTIHEYELGNLRLGEVEHQTRAVNFQSYYVTGTTPSTANTEFSVLHGLPQAPHVAIPVLDLLASGAQLVPLATSRAADSKRVYLKSSSTSAAFALLIE